MKLYYIKGACSLASHIALREAGAEFSIEAYDKASGKTETGSDFKAINPKGYVPALSLNDDVTLTEGVAILQYIADQFPDTTLAPANGTLDRSRLQEHLNYISTELHKAFSPFFATSSSDEDKTKAGQNVANKLTYLNSLLADKPFLLGEQFTVADAYLFTVANWANFVGIDLSKWSNITAFMTRVAARPAVQAALKAEGLAS